MFASCWTECGFLHFRFVIGHGGVHALGKEFFPIFRDIFAHGRFEIPVVAKLAFGYTPLDYAYIIKIRPSQDAKEE